MVAGGIGGFFILPRMLHYAPGSMTPARVYLAVGILMLASVLSAHFDYRNLRRVFGSLPRPTLANGVFIGFLTTCGLVLTAAGLAFYDAHQGLSLVHVIAATSMTGSAIAAHLYVNHWFRQYVRHTNKLMADREKGGGV